MLKLIIFLLAVYIAYKLLTNDFLKKKKQREECEKKETDEKISAGDMVQDPECGAYVVPEDSVSVRDGDRVYYFCGYECRDKFLKRLAGSGNAIHADTRQNDQ